MKKSRTIPKTFLVYYGRVLARYEGKPSAATARLAHWGYEEGFSPESVAKALEVRLRARAGMAAGKGQGRRKAGYDKGQGRRKAGYDKGQGRRKAGYDAGKIQAKTKIIVEIGGRELDVLLVRQRNGSFEVGVCSNCGAIPRYGYIGDITASGDVEAASNADADDRRVLKAMVKFLKNAGAFQCV